MIQFYVYTELFSAIISGTSVWQSINAEADVTSDRRYLSQVSSWQPPLQVRLQISIARQFIFSASLVTKLL